MAAQRGDDASTGHNVDRGPVLPASPRLSRRPGATLARPSLLGAVGVAIVTAAISGCSSGSTKGSTDPSVPADQDVTITSCAPSDDQAEGYLAKISVTNHEAQANDYVVTVTFVGPDGAQVLDRAAVALARVDPGQTVEDETTSPKAELRSTPGVTCKIAAAQRSLAG